MSFTILLVDDDDVAVEAMQRSMINSKVLLPVVVAEDGQVALDILQNKHPDKTIRLPYIVLLDINMPRMDGFEFLDAIRADPILKPTIVFMLTTSGLDSDRARAYDKNIAGYLVKSSVGEQFKYLFALLQDYCAAVRPPPLVE